MKSDYAPHQIPYRSRPYSRTVSRRVEYYHLRILTDTRGNFENEAF